MKEISGNRLPVYDREFDPNTIQDVSSAQFQLWLAQAQRDKNMISSKELTIVEKIAGPLAKKSKTIFNPFTGEIRKVSI